MPTDQFGTILCPVDFSDISAYALRAASLLAAHCGPAAVIAMYADSFEAPPYFTVDRVAELAAERRESLRSAEQALAAFARSTLGDAADQVAVRAIEALAADGILRLAAETSAGLIAMGTHGRSGLNRWTLGSVAERVLHESAAPVLTVRTAPPDSIRQVLCPVTDTEASRRALSVAASVSACFDARLTVLHVREPAGIAAVSDLCSWISPEARARCDIRELVLHGNAAEEIVRLAAQEPYDLIVLGAARRRFFGGMVFGTTTLRTVRHAPCPVLSVGAAPDLAHPEVSSEKR